MPTAMSTGTISRVVHEDSKFKESIRSKAVSSIQNASGSGTRIPAIYRSATWPMNGTCLLYPDGTWLFLFVERICLFSAGKGFSSFKQDLDFCALGLLKAFP